MCGIIAFSGNENFNVDKIKSLFLFNASRGTDACGMYNNEYVTKSTCSILSVINDWEFVPEKKFLGHTRKSTSCHKEIKNAHPFDIGNIIGVHNGTLTDLYNFCRKHELSFTELDTDSEALMCALNKTYNALKEIDGSASIVFHNKQEPDTIFCFRKNEERPLWRGKTEEGMYISSMKESLDFIGCSNIEEFKTSILYKIVNGKIAHTQKYKEREKTTNYNNNIIPFTNNNTYFERHNGFLEGYVGGFIKVKSIDATAFDLDHNVVVGGYYKLTQALKTDDRYCSFMVDTDKNGNKLRSPKNLMYYKSCVENYCITKAGEFALCTTDGASFTKKGDIVYIKSIESPLENTEKSKITYDILYPNTEKRDTLKVIWERKHFRLLQSYDVYKIWNDMTDDEKNSLGSFFKEKLGSMYSSVKNYYTNQPVSTTSTQENDITKFQDKISQFSKEKMTKMLSIIHKKNDPQNILKNIMETVLSDNFDVSSTDTTDNNNFNTFIEFTGIDMDILNVVWIEFGSILENIQRLYDNIKQAEDDLRKLYQEAIITTMENSKDEETPEDGSLYPYEDIELYDEIVNLENTISSCRLELEEISEKVIKEYMSYDRNYKITV